MNRGTTLRGLYCAFVLLPLAHQVMGELTVDFQQASWVWADADTDGIELADEPSSEMTYLRKSFIVPEGTTVTRAVLSLTADLTAEVWINGATVGTSNPDWRQAFIVEVTDRLQPGQNLIAVRAQNINLPRDAGGVIAQLTVGLRTKDGSEQELNFGSDPSWKAVPIAPPGWEKPAFDDAGWGSAVPLVPWGGYPWQIPFTGTEGGVNGVMPEFLVNENAKLLDPLRDILKRHFLPGVTCALWDPWLPRSLLWTGFSPEPLDAQTRSFYSNSLLGRQISTEGCVEMRQHRGLGLPDGWPAPLWIQGPGAGWHFSVVGNPYGTPVYGIGRLTNADGWIVDGATTNGFDELKGWMLHLNKANASITTPMLKAEKIVSPYLRLEWRADGLPRTAQPYLEWTTKKEPEFSSKRRLYFPPAQPTDGLVFSLLPLYKVPNWDGPITQFRIQFDNPPGAKIGVVALFTASDSRLPITNSDFILGSTDFFNWTGDLNFLRMQINRLRLATAFNLREFGVEKNGLAYVPWPGHEGRSGVIYVDGKKVIRPGEGVGNNYYDILPFGGWDAYLNIRIYAALTAMSKLEAAIDANPQWNLPDSPLRRSAEQIDAIADRLKTSFQEKFWNPNTKRFVGAIDADGLAHDYGFTAVNLESIVYGLAATEQAREIFAWLDGERIVDGDTSKGGDIYRWRFGPRMSTLRNVDYYMYGWTAPESIPFGDQIQDGGAVMGFSYYDILARIDTLGPDNAWERLKAILDWYKEVQEYGGYRKYYADHDGALQGGGPHGGLGLDQEFMESVMLPSVLIYGFMGLEATPSGLQAKPRLPQSWPSFRISNIFYQDWNFGLTANAKTKVLTAKVLEGDPTTLEITLPDDWRFEKDPP